jgi:thiamine biosynthesis lipoprotein
MSDLPLNKNLPLLCAMVLLALFNACQTPGPTNADDYLYLQGKTMGTTYNIKCAASNATALQAGIDSLLAALNMEVSTYIPASVISRFNQADSIFAVSRASAPHFAANFDKAKEVWEQSGGAFDPTVMPLVNYWGFGYEKARHDSLMADTLQWQQRLALVGFERVSMTQNALTKHTKGVQLDFSALAKGYGVDAVAMLLESRGIHDYMVEIGGETRAKGHNPSGQIWVIGINTPREGAGTAEFFQKVLLDGRALATSGNYRNFYELDGRKFVHTINPKTGKPEINHLLSASILADDCMTADAYATACMVLGEVKGFELVEKTKGLEAYFIYSQADGSFKVKHTQGFGKTLTQ